MPHKNVNTVFAKVNPEVRRVNILERWKPAAARRTLLYIAGVFWSIAGITLIVRGSLFIRESTGNRAILIAAGLLGGALFFLLVFVRVSARHIARIQSIAPDRPCLFSFLSWRSYILMGVMIGLGVALRKSGLAPLPQIGAFYVAMGMPLAASAARFVIAGGKWQRTPIRGGQPSHAGSTGGANDPPRG